jgi:Spy/CpxP family protein refolding chaperone
MKTKSIILVLALSLSSIAIACPGGKHRSDERQQHRENLLNLTEGQKIEFDKIMTHKRESMQQAMTNIHEETFLELSKVLTQEQMDQLKSQKEKHSMQRKNKRMKLQQKE